VITDEVRDQIAIAVEMWADDNLPGRPAVLGHMVYLDMCKALEEKEAEIEKTFPKEADSTKGKKKRKLSQGPGWNDPIDIERW